MAPLDGAQRDAVHCRTRRSRWQREAPSSRQQAELAADFVERGVRPVEMLGLERGGHLDADPRRPFRDDGVPEARDEDAPLEQPLAEADRERGLAENDRDDRRLAREGVESRPPADASETRRCARAAARPVPDPAPAVRSPAVRCTRSSAGARSRRGAVANAGRGRRRLPGWTPRSRPPRHPAPCRAST